MTTDVALYVDPYAISIVDDPWFIECNNLIVDYFQLVIDSIRNKDKKTAYNLLNNLHEPNDTHLGLSTGKPSGRGIGAEQAKVLYGRLSKSKAIQSGKLTDLADCELYIPGIGSDKISDITINIIRQKIIEYTVTQCDLLGIPTREIPSGLYWDSSKRKWANHYANLPEYKDQRIILIPKAAVRFVISLDHQQYYRHFVLEYLQREHLSANSALVTTLKNGKRKVYKNKLEEIYPLDKDFLTKFSEEHPEVLDSYKKAKREKIRPISDEEIEEVQNDGRRVDIEKLKDYLLKIPLVGKNSEIYSGFILGVLETIFYPELRRPQKNNGNLADKYLRVTFNNAADKGFFFNLETGHKISSREIYFECRNEFLTDNKGFEPLLKHLDPRSSQLGIFVCRNVKNLNLTIEHCRKIAKIYKYYILVLSDKDILILLDFRREKNFRAISDYLEDRLREILPKSPIRFDESFSKNITTESMEITPKIDGSLREKISEALRNAFTKRRLEQMLDFRLDKRLDEVTSDGTLIEIVYELIKISEAEGWLPNLVLAAREFVPNNLLLFEIAQIFQLAVKTPSEPDLEKIINQSNSFLDVNTWRTQLGKIEGQVCRIELYKSNRIISYGTGFLLNSDVVMTNYHVMEAVIKGQVKPENVILRFDYKVLSDGLTTDKGTEYKLHKKEWLIDSSPMASGGLPKSDELDYALLRTKDKPGEHSIGKTQLTAGADLRGWISLINSEYVFETNSTLCIMQHPKGEPLKLAIETNAIINTNSNGTRVKYKTNTEPGSSGSPCFNMNWELIALHHSGYGINPPTHNEGTPFSAIQSLLEKRNLWDLIGKGQ